MVLEELGNPPISPLYWVVLSTEKEMLVDCSELCYQHNGTAYYYVFHKECFVVLKHNRHYIFVS